MLAESFVVGYGGLLGRFQSNQLDFASFHSGPSSMVSPGLGFGAGISIWKTGVDGTVLFARTGQEIRVSGPTRETEQSKAGSARFADIGAAYPLFHIAGFNAAVRGGYGSARVRVATEIPIEDDRQYWNYGVALARRAGSRYTLRVDIRNVHFAREKIPETLGRFNVVVLVGFGLRVR
jgi:hypothetical protein